MCIFSTLIIWKLHFKIQTSFEAQNFVLLLSLSLHSSSPTFKLLSMASYGGELLIDSSSPWRDVFDHLSSFSFCCHWSSRSKELHWRWRYKAYKLYMELHHEAKDSVWICPTLPCLISSISIYYHAILPPKALDKRLQEDWANDAREGPRVLMSLRVDFEPMG